MRAPMARNQVPSYDVIGWVSSRSRSSTNSENRLTRSPAESSPVPSTPASKPVPPAPTPSWKRPSETSSRLISSLANGTGWRKFGDATNVPRRIRLVTRAAAVSVGTVANHGLSARLRQDRWS